MERWLPVPDFEGRYEVSDLGAVRSLPRVAHYEQRNARSGTIVPYSKTIGARVLRPQTRASGHLVVNLFRDGVPVQCFVHRLVLEAFVGPRPEGLESLHRNDDPTDNRVGNLRWGTRSENILEGIANGKIPVGAERRSAKLTEDDVRAIRRKVYSRGMFLALADKYSVSPGTIFSAYHGRTWKAVAA